MYLVVEKVEHVNGMQHIQQDHRVGNIANFIVLSSSKRQVNQSPCNNPRSPIVKELEIKVLSKSRVEFNAHKQVVDGR